MHYKTNRLQEVCEGAEIGMPIPEEFYKPVADILAYIYRLRKSKTAGPADGV